MPVPHASRFSNTLAKGQTSIWKPSPMTTERLPAAASKALSDVPPPVRSKPTKSDRILRWGVIGVAILLSAFSPSELALNPTRHEKIPYHARLQSPSDTTDSLSWSFLWPDLQTSLKDFLTSPRRHLPHTPLGAPYLRPKTQTSLTVA